MPSLTKIRTTFSFEKLKRQIKGIIKDEYTKYGEVLADFSKANLVRGVDQKGQPLKELVDQTKRKRGRGGYPGKKDSKSRATKSDKPLIYTGKLEKSIKGIQRGFSMNDYGELHDTGKNTIVGGEKVTRKVMPRRSFIAQPDGKQFQDRAKKELITQFVDKLERALTK